MVKKAALLCEEKKADNIVILDMRGQIFFTDYFLICSGNTKVQSEAIAEFLIDSFRESGTKAKHIEGKSDLEWVLVDFGDFVAHVFTAGTREFYNLEKLWADAPQVKYQ